MERHQTHCQLPRVRGYSHCDEPMTTSLAQGFRHFRLLPQRRCQLAGEEPIQLGALALDPLVTQVESP